MVACVASPKSQFLKGFCLIFSDVDLIVISRSTKVLLYMNALFYFLLIFIIIIYIYFLVCGSGTQEEEESQEEPRCLQLERKTTSGRVHVV